MARSVFLGFISIILVLSFLLVNSRIKIKAQKAELNSQIVKIDSLSAEIDALELTNGSLQWVIDQAHEKNPKEIDKILQESE